MKDRIVLSLVSAHRLFYRGSVTLVDTVTRYAPERYVSAHTLTTVAGRDTWTRKWLARDVTVFDNILPDSMLRGGFVERLLYVSSPGSHVHNEGFARWWRVASAMTGAYYKESHVLRN